MTTVDTAIKETLGQHPREKFNDWSAEIAEFADLLSSPGRWDINNLLINDAQWLLLNPIANPGDPITPRLPPFPAVFAPNAAAAVVAQHRLSHDTAVGAADAAKKFKTGLIASLGPDIQLETSVPGQAHRTKQPWEIFDYVTQHYGTLNATDIARIDRDIRTYQTASAFPTNAARMARGFLSLAAVGRYAAEVDKVQVLTEATAGITQIARFVDLYKIANPTIAAQTFTNLVTYITVQLPNVTATAAGYSNNTAAAPPARDAEIDELRRQVSELTASVSAVRASPRDNAARGTQGGRSGRGGRGGRGSQGGRGRGRTGTAAPKPYCFAHGCAGHTGRECNTMHDDSSYTNAMKDATAPGVIDGWEGCKHNAP